MVGRQAEHEVGQDEAAACCARSDSPQPGKGRPPGRAGERERIGAVAARDAGLPVEVTAAAAAERRIRSHSLRVDRAAVVALVVVLQDHLPVGGDLVDDPVGRPQLRERVGGEPAVGPVQLGRPAGASRPGLGIEPGEDEPAPGGDGDRVQRQPVTVAAQLRQERRGAQRPVKAVGPAVEQGQRIAVPAQPLRARSPPGWEPATGTSREPRCLHRL